MIVLPSLEVGLARAGPCPLAGCTQEEEFLGLSVGLVQAGSYPLADYVQD